MISLTEQVTDLCTHLTSQLGTGAIATTTAIASVREASRGPLVVAVAGRVNAGKSTVVNALMGQKVARTDSRECTNLVTAFRYGPSEYVEVLMRDGSRREVPLDSDGLVPADLGGDAVRVDVVLPNTNLAGLTIVDTPGLASVRSENSRRSEEFLGLEQDDPGSVNAAGSASAVLYVFTQAFREDDREAVRGFRAVSNLVGSSPSNAVGVLNKADKLGDGTSLDDAVRLAANQTDALRRELATVLPVVGLLGETVEVGRFTEAHADALRAIAALRSGERQLLMFSADRFVRTEVAVSQQARQELLDRLDLFGIATALRLIDSGQSTATAIRSALHDTSGIAALRATIHSRFRSRSDALRAADAVARLKRIAGATADYSAARLIGGELERFLLRPDAHLLAELAVSADLAASEVTLPADLTEQALRLLSEQEPAGRVGLPADASVTEIAQAAASAANRWRSYANVVASPAQARVAMTLHRSCALLYETHARRAAAASEVASVPAPDQNGGA